MTKADSVGRGGDDRGVVLSDEEQTRRRPVWYAVSDLFLDTETRWELPRIAQVLLASGYDEPELDAIFQWEVVPECVWNLYAVAGEWAAMPIDEARLARRAARRASYLRRMLVRMTTPEFLRVQWRAVLDLRALLAELTEPAGRSLVRVWSALAHAYLEVRLDDLFTLDSQLVAIRESGLSRARCETALRDEIAPLYRGLLTSSERLSEPARRACGEALIARAFARESARDGESA